jgi:heterodisulfide reductase subunit D
MARLPRINRELSACLQCGYCLRVCDTYAQEPWESISPRGKIFYLKQLQNKTPIDRLLGRKVEVDDEFVDALYRCTGCAACWTVCHVSIEFAEFWETVREWVVDQGKGPMPAHKKIREKIEATNNPYGEPPEKRGAWFPESIKKVETNPDVCFFAGCTASYRMQRIPQAAAVFLDRCGVKQNVMGEQEMCCTSPMLRTGQVTATRDFAENNVRQTERMGAKAMVTACAGCFKTTTHDYKRFYSNPAFEVYHFSQYAQKLVKEKKVKYTRELKSKVTYHDPCHLGRHAGVFEPPREVIKSIPGIELVEMPRNRMASQCCGAGGGYKSQFNDLAVNIAAKRVKEAVATGAERIITTCPFCVLNLQAGAKQLGVNIKVMDLSELLAEVTAPVEPAPAAPAAAPVAP